MKLKVYAYFNKLINAFGTNLQFDDHDDEKVVFNVSRALNARLALNKYEDLRYLSFYKLGVFDDEKGSFEADKKLLLDLDSVIAQYEAKNTAKEVNDNVGESVNA